MREGTVRVVWCEECCNRHWGVMNRLAVAGRVVSTSGTLKIAVECGMCRSELAAGAEGTAFTLDGGPDEAVWEGEYLDLDPQGVCVAGDF